MAFGTVTLRLRPLKFGLLVNPADPDALLEAIQLNTLLWGGVYNPIFPAISRLPPRWRSTGTVTTAAEIVTGYIEAFDPDYLVPIRGADVSRYAIGHRKTLTVAGIVGDLATSGATSYGIGLPEMCRYVADEELRFVRQEPYSLDVMTFGTRYRCFLAAVFGSLTAEHLELVRLVLAGRLAPHTQDVSVEGYAEHLGPGPRFLRRFGAEYLDVFGSGGGLNRPGFPGDFLT